ncbi:hypothetical protein AAC03nite_25820 [Alicyclobacillus acidoterrestris]|nr:hypothetical protein AAC03nite_25820 [Alicyclobacillus acidoterrestris]
MGKSELRVRRLICFYAIWIILSAVLLGRLFLVMVFPHGFLAGAGGVSVPRWKLDAEHFDLEMTSDARGHIEFADGRLWQAAGMAGNVKQSGGQQADVNSPATPQAIEALDSAHSDSARASVVAPEIVGAIGLPDVWPKAGKVVPEQGRSGLEYTFDALLSGRRPGLIGQIAPPTGASEVPPAMKPSETFTLTPISGKNVVTTMDESKQRAAEQLLRAAGVAHASIVSIALPDGDISVLASANHQFSDALRAIAPGSVFKLVTGAAALESHTYRSDAHFVCRGFLRIPRVRLHCWRTHGRLSLREAIAQSCDVAFAEMGIRLGRTALAVQAQRFGLDTTGLVPYGAEDMIPGADKGVVYRHSGEDEGLLANTAIGQEDVRMTPLQGALLAATLAEDGRYHRARLVRGFSDAQGRFTPFYRRRADATGRDACSPYTASVLREGMWAAVHNPSGTAYPLHTYPIAAKTGTAELPNGHVNAWLIGYQVNASGTPISAFAICVADEPSAQAHAHLFALAKKWLAPLAPPACPNSAARQIQCPRCIN